MDFKEQNCHYSTPHDEYCGESKQEDADDTDDNYNNVAGAFADDNYYNSGRLMLLLETVVMLIAVKMLTLIMLMRGEVGDCDDADHECDYVDDDYDYNDDGD